jgi:hypothetical protein
MLTHYALDIATKGWSATRRLADSIEEKAWKIEFDCRQRRGSEKEDSEENGSEEKDREKWEKQRKLSNGIS